MSTTGTDHDHDGGITGAIADDSDTGQAMARALAKHRATVPASGGVPARTNGATTPATIADRSEQQLRAAIEKIETSPDYRAGDKATLHRLTGLYEQLYGTGAPGQATADPEAGMWTPDEARRMLNGYDPIDGLPAHYREQWQGDAYAAAVQGLRRFGLPPAKIEGIVRRYVGEGILEGRFETGFNADDAARWQAYLTEQGLTGEQAAQVVRFVQSGGTEA